MNPGPVPIKKWYGNWEVDLELLVIRWQDKKSAYCWEFDLERMTSSAQILDMIMQANTHRDAVFTNADIGDLVNAIQWILHPQANYCSVGQEKMTKENYKKLMAQLSKVKPISEKAYKVYINRLREHLAPTTSQAIH